VNQVRSNPWNDIIYYLSLKSEGQPDIVFTASRINALTMEKRLVFSEMQPILWHYTAHICLFFLQKRGQTVAENGFVIRHGHMDIRTLPEKFTDKRG
jgi:hypothetical protein